MTTNTNPARALQKLLEDNWRESIDGRDEDVPKPVIKVTKDQPTLSSSEILTHDYVFVSAPGTSSREPVGFEWSGETVEDLCSIDIRTVDQRGGYERLFGPVDDSYGGERYGGLIGEAIRVFQDHRKGFGDWSQLNAYEGEDLSDQMGKRVYRGTIEVRLTSYATDLDPTP